MNRDDNKVEFIDGKENHLRGEGILMNYSGGDVAILPPASFKKSIHNQNKKRDENCDLFLITSQKTFRSFSKYNNIYRSKICYKRDGSVLFIADTGIIWQKDTIQKLILAFSKEIINYHPICVFQSKDNKIWVSTINNGIFCYNLDNPTEKPKRYLENKGIATLAEDQENNIWIVTLGDGIYMLPVGYKAVNNYYADKYEKHRIYSVAKDKYGNIYTGHDEQIVNVLKSGKTHILPIKRKNEYSNNRVTRLVTYKDDIWIGTDNNIRHINVLKKYNKVIKGQYFSAQSIGHKDSVFIIPNIKDITVYKENILICNGYAVYKPDTAWYINDILKPINNNSRTRTYSVHADYKGIIWYSTVDGLYSFNGKATQNHSSESIYLSKRVNDIDETIDSVLVLATSGYGVILYRNGKVLCHITENSGLSSNICKRLFVCKNDIYVATANGASRLSYNNGHIDSVKIFSTKNGLLSNSVNDICADDSEICFATSEGLTIINMRLLENNSNVPKVYITGIKCNSRKLSTDSIYSFNYDQNSLQFNFIGICYRLPEDVIYQSRLTEDQAWLETKNTSIDFPSLAPGIYHFQLRAKISNGPWSSSNSFYFIIKPPFWKTYWFLALCAFSFIILAILVARYQLNVSKRKQQEQLKIKDQMAQLEQQAIQAMMNPHFIFNVMNSIQHYINNNEKHDANLYLTNFARLIRMNLDISSKRYISLDDEITYLEQYLSLETLRFGQRLTYKIDIDPAIDGYETVIPVMLLQPFIENAIWHGILPKKENGHVQVDIKKEKDNMLKIQITDNGIGISVPLENIETGMKTHISQGMKLTQQRLNLIGKITGHILYINVHDAFPGDKYKGTQVEILLPDNLS